MPLRRKNRFNAQMQKAFPMFRCGKTDYEAICRTCDSIIDVGNKGQTALVQNIKTASHLSKSRASDGSQKLTVFTTVKNTKLQGRVSAAEAIFAYHTVEHGSFMAVSKQVTARQNYATHYSVIWKLKKNFLAPA
jgi:hypothetical protein